METIIIVAIIVAILVAGVVFVTPRWGESGVSPLRDIESAYGEIVNPQLDLYREAFMHAPVEKKVAKKAPPAYLQHDPTKRHKRRRKGK